MEIKATHCHWIPFFSLCPASRRWGGRRARARTRRLWGERAARAHLNFIRSGRRARSPSSAPQHKQAQTHAPSPRAPVRRIARARLVASRPPWPCLRAPWAAVALLSTPFPLNGRLGLRQARRGRRARRAPSQIADAHTRPQWRAAAAAAVAGLSWSARARYKPPANAIFVCV